MPVVNDFTALIFDNPAFRFNNVRDAATPVIVTYSFDDRVEELPDESEFSGRDIGDFTTGFSNAAQQQAARDALALFEAAGGIRFVEVETDGMIQFVDATSIFSNGNVVSFANVPVTNATQANLGHVVMNQAHFPITPGNSGFTILAHEIGHALGLDHSDEGVNTLNPALEVVSNTIMASVGNGQAITDIGVFDKQAIQFLYGQTTDFNLDQLIIANDAANNEIDITGTSGVDKFVAPAFDTNVDMGGGNDVFFGSVGADEVDGDDGNDHLIGGAGDDILRGGIGADTLDGLGFLQGNFIGGADQLFGGDGDDVLIDRFDTAIFDGGDGDDTLDASTRSQTVIQFTDTTKFVSIENVILSDGNDFFRGVGGDDNVQGGLGDDTLIGDGGDDFLDGGAGADQMQGAADNDTYVIDNVGDQIFESSGTDKVIAHIDFTLPSSIENGTAIGAVALTGNSGGNTIDGDGGANTLNGDGGNDILIGRAGDDTLNGGAGIDRLNGSDGADAMAGGADNDIYEVDNVGDTVTENAGEGNDRINTVVDFTNPDFVEFLVGKFAPVGLTLTGNGSRDRITGANKINSGDTINGENGNDKLVGLVGNDVFNGGAGNDRIFGNSGDDVIDGGAGNDRISGQQNADRFVMAPGGGRDRVTDFDVTEDLLDLTAFNFADANAALAIASDVNGSVEFNLPGSDAITLEGVAKAALGTEDILT